MEGGHHPDHDHADRRHMLPGGVVEKHAPCHDQGEYQGAGSQWDRAQDRCNQRSCDDDPHGGWFDPTRRNGSIRAEGAVMPCIKEVVQRRSEGENARGDQCGAEQGDPDGELVDR